MRRRGVVFGWTPVFMEDEVMDFGNIVRKYHGYLALFGITLTFWYAILCIIIGKHSAQ
jgi:hypothetical protein